MRSKKGSGLTLETIIVFALLLFLLIIVLAIVIPRLKTVNVFDDCPSGMARCVSMYSGTCSQHMVLDKYKCDTPDKVCCQYTQEEILKIHDGENILDKCDAPEEKNVIECLCNSETDKTFNTTTIGQAGDFGFFAKDCISNAKTEVTKYCIPVNEEPYSNYLNQNNFDIEISPYYCFEFNPLQQCDTMEILKEKCKCGENNCNVNQICSNQCYDNCNQTFGFGPCFCQNAYAICNENQACSNEGCVNR